MKKLIIIILIFLPLVVYSQSDSLEKGFSLNLSISYLFPQVSDGPGGIRSGLAVKPSLQLKTSKNITWFTEFSYSRLKYEDRFGGLYGGHSYYLNYMYFNFGVKIYPKKIERIYIKPGIGLSYSDLANKNNFGYSINIGIGNDIKLSNKISIYPEGEIHYHPRLLFVSWHSLYDLILSIGIKYKL